MLGERGLDERTRPVKRYKALARAYASDLGGNPSTAQRALLSRAAGLQVLAELQEVAMAEGGEVDVAAYVKRTNGLVTVLRTIGLARRLKDVNSADSAEPIESKVLIAAATIPATTRPLNPTPR